MGVMIPDAIRGSRDRMGVVLHTTPHPAKGFASGLQRAFGASLLTLSKRQRHAPPTINTENTPKLSATILADKKTECCGNLETHDYQLHFDVNGIKHTRTKARYP